jgi:hypothetical protein
MSARRQSAEKLKFFSERGEWARPAAEIFFGKNDRAAAEARRRALPDSVFLLYAGADIPDSPWNMLSVPAGPLWPELLAETLSVIRPDGHRTSVGFDAEAPRAGEEAAKAKGLAATVLSNLKCSENSGLLHLLSSIANIPFILSGKSFTPSPFHPDTPVVVCGAGPSLASQFGTLKENLDRAVIISVGHAVKPMLSAGLEPDFAVEFDPETGPSWEGLGKLGFALAAAPQTPPSAARCFDKILWGAPPDSPLSQMLESAGLRLPALELSRSVIITALDFAVKNGARRIALAGSDLCLSSSGAAYADGATERGAAGMETEGSDGGKVPTNWVFEGIKESLEDFLSGLETRGISVRNCTAGGARIRHCERVSLEKFLEESPPQGKTVSFTEKFSDPAPAWRYFRKTAEALRTGDSAGGAPKIRAFAKNFAENIAREIPRQLREDSRVSAVRDRLERDIISDIAGGMKTAFEEIEGGPPPKTPVKFTAFRKFAADFMELSNPPYAAMLRANSVPPDPFEITIVTNQQYIPHVRIRPSGGPETALSERLSIEEKAREEILSFLRSRSFRESSHGVVFFCPGDWAHTVEFAREFPHTEILVMETTPGLFSRMIVHAMFLNIISPEKCRAAVCVPELRDWKKICHRTLREWKTKGLKPLCFSHPAIGFWPEFAPARDFLNEELKNWSEY